VQIARELGMDVQVVSTAIGEIKKASGWGEDETREEKKTALCLLDAQEGVIKNIVTYCKSLDDMLGGGVRINQITEFCGVPGCGKTQICMQLCVDVTIPNAFGGIEGHALYIDTEGSFSGIRVRDMAQGVRNNLAKVCHSRRLEHSEKTRDLQADALKEFGEVDDILSRIHYCRVHNHSEQVAVILTLEKYLASHPEVRLVVIDSVAFHFRQEFADMAQRTRLLNSLGQTLNRVATSCDVAVVVTNQMTTKVSGSNGSHLVAALGEAWSHSITSRVLVERTTEQVEKSSKRQRLNTKTFSNVRKASLQKSCDQKRGYCASFVITGWGVRDHLVGR